LFPTQALKQTGADICVQGDGEQVIGEVRKALVGKLDFAEIAGIVFWVDGKIESGRPVQLVHHLDEVGFAARHLVSKYVYGKGLVADVQPGEFTSIVTSRGCPFSCRFCSRNSVSMKTYRMRSLDNIIEELKQLYGLGYRYIAFNDDCFLSNKKLAVDLFQAIIDEGLVLRFFITAARVDSADEQLYALMKRAGVCFLQFGLESGNQDVLDFYHKNITIDQSKKAVELSHAMGFFTAGSFIFGAPFETKAHLKQTVGFAQSLPLNSVSFVPLLYMAGSDLWNEAVLEGKIDEERYLVQADVSEGLGLFTAEQLHRFCSQASWSFYFRVRFVVDLVKICVRQQNFSFLWAYVWFLVKR